MDATDAHALADLDAIAQAGLVASGEVSATELLEAAIVRLEGARRLNAVIADLFDRGRQQAAAARRLRRIARWRVRSAGGSSLPAQGSWGLARRSA
jgi:Asp-tRNA(Asn)/Glu-tRNA(Gln) amidotransferase A subunit family amidase